MTSLISFLGGSVFRMLWGEFSHWLTAGQDHTHELQRMALQEQIDAAQHARQLDALRLQAEMGQKLIRVKSEAAIDEMEAAAWQQATQSIGRTVGIAFVDAWNAIIRPSVATWSVVMLTLSEFYVITLSDNALSVCAAALGIYLADRNLMKRGK